MYRRDTTYTILHPMIKRARKRALLITLLHECLEDDAKGIVNVGREKAINKLFNDLRK